LSRAGKGIMMGKIAICAVLAKIFNLREENQTDQKVLITVKTVRIL
jgi:hypothetical protein